MTFQTGDRVRRIEDREITAATVLEIAETDGEAICLIAYDEGGEGWWPETALTLEAAGS
jgi:hypothetical protein